jgi:hypothetical protein
MLRFQRSPSSLPRVPITSLPMSQSKAMRIGWTLRYFLIQLRSTTK